MISTNAALIAVLRELPADLPPFVTNGDLPDAPVSGVSVEAADYGQMILISGRAAGLAPAASREQLSHLAADWDARAAQSERKNLGGIGFADALEARIYRLCAEQLRARLGITEP
jgi:hypothetical protein